MQRDREAPPIPDDELSPTQMLLTAYEIPRIFFHATHFVPVCPMKSSIVIRIGDSQVTG